MPNITIYLNDEEYTKFIHMNEESQDRLRKQFKEELKCQ